ncbi:T9SS type A sorting domain-containing protein [uncultured Winogradskyella sp.]|uniref:endonuclease/exonuclease/phosphatase family protein n=1 Tax=Winogradskyella sp. 4-2091 TaxID=3381659 RepID=UPI00262A5B48|nr:T9SS type A sorting domain-containing protein [uncultured Winogradskyella sp.]
MKKKIIGFFTIILFAYSNVSAQETFKVMFYNLLNYPLEDAVSNRINDLEYILNDYQPDLFLVCELNNITGATNVLNTAKSAINSNFEMASYVSNSSDDNYGDQNDLQNLLYYDSTKFSVEEEIIVPTYLRDFNVYRVQLNSVNQDTNPIEIYIIIGHLKASSGTSNAQKRYEMILDLESYLDTLPTDTNVLLGGDLNVYTSSEAAFQSLINASNNITFADPANRIGSWHNNSSYVDVFTQSTRTQTGMGGSTGGFDDRFDFILTSENMINTANITYVPNSYKVYGNNGLASCWNKSINSNDCETTGSQFSYTLRNALHNFSDHLPVTLSLETDESFLSIDDFKTVTAFSLEQTLINDTLIVNMNESNNINQQLIAYNALGQSVKTFNLNSDTKQFFNVSELQNGLYYLVLSHGNSNPLKFIVSN